MFLSKKITNLGLRFDGVNDYITFGDILGFTNENFSFSFHFKMHSLNGHNVFFSKSVGATGYYSQMYYYYPDNSWYLIFYNQNTGNGIFTQFTPTFNKLYKVVITREGLIGKFYIDNIEKPLTNISASSNLYDFATNTDPFVLSAYYNAANPLVCNDITYYDFKVFNKVLTTNEISELSTNDGQVPSTANANVLLDCRFNDKQGYTLTDQSGNNYNGTLVNFAAGTTDLGDLNSWKNIYSEPITLYSLNRLILANNKIQNGYSYHKNGLQTDGVNDYIDFGNILNTLTFNFTFSVKLKFLGSNTLSTNILGNANPLNSGFIFTYESGLLLFATYQAGAVQITYFDFTFNNTQTYNLVVIGTTNTISLYINNVLIPVYTSVNTPHINPTIATNSFKIGFVTTYFRQMIFYDLKAFDKALNTTELSSLYNTNNKIVPATAQSNLQLDCRFDNKKGYVVTDKSGLNRNGTLINYAAGTTDLGTSNSWKDIYGNSITSL